MCEKNTAGWLTDKLGEQSEYQPNHIDSFNSEIPIPGKKGLGITDEPLK